MHDIHTVFQDLAKEVAASHFILDTKSYDAVKDLFRSCFIARSDRLRLLTKEFSTPEFLACVDNEGKMQDIPITIVMDYYLTSQQYPTFCNWFRVVQNEDTQKQVLLPARGLCHLVGFRHLTVQLFIDLPSSHNLTLVQIRSSQKAEAPGCLDLPVAGHRINLDTIEDTLHKELKEETGFTFDDLEDLTEIDQYNYHHPSDTNNEYRIVYASRLK